MYVHSMADLKPKKDLWMLSYDGIMESLSGRKVVLVGNIQKIDVLEFIPPSAGGDKLTRSAAGAVLGFLVAGPIGTLAGAGLGAGGTREPEPSAYRIHLVIKQPFEFFNATVNEHELRELQKYFAEQARPVSGEPARVLPSRPQRDQVNASLALPEKKRKLVRSKSTTKPQQAAEKAARSAELQRRIDKLNWLHKEGYITEESYQAGCANAKKYAER